MKSEPANLLPTRFITDIKTLGTLNQIIDDVVMTKYAVVIHGHTDNTGSAERNMTLSEARANSVKGYFQRKAAQNFPNGRVRVIPHGQEDPIADNTTESGRAKNRRVQIVLGTLE